MALKVWDGFDHYNALSDFQARSGFLQWQEPGPGTPTTFAFVTGRVGGKAVESGAFSTSISYLPIRAVWGDRNATATIGQAVMIPAGATGGASFWKMCLVDTVANKVQVSIVFNPGNYSVEIWRGGSAYTGSSSYGSYAYYDSGTLLYTSSNNVWAGDRWNFVEVKATIDNTAGAVEVRVNEQTVAIISGADTQVSANAWFDATDYFPMRLSGAYVSFFYLDDLYYADDTIGPGTFAADTFLGDCRVFTGFATADSSVTWTPLTAVNYEEINEQAMDSDSSYNSSSTPGDEDTFLFEPITGSLSLIFGLQLTIAARKDDAGPHVIKSALKSGSTEDYSSDDSLSTSYQYFSHHWILDPDTGANWDLTGINSFMAGYNLVS